MAVNYYSLLSTLGIFVCVALAFDPMPTQDFCVADFQSPLRHNVPLPCKDPVTVTADDFYTSSLSNPGNTDGARVALTPAGLTQVPGLNTMGLTVVRQDLAPGGLFPPHTHQKATEIHVVLEGVLEVGFVASDRFNYTMYSKTLAKGDLFVVPMGLVHYQRNGWKGKTAALAILNSQNPGINSVTNAVFGSKPPINADYLASAYRLDKKTIVELQAKHLK